MSTFEDRPQAALLVIDAQNGVLAPSVNAGAVVAKIATLVGEARAQSVPVIWVQHSDASLVRDTDDWRITAELMPGADEPIVHKQYGDAFEATDLAEQLAQAKAGRLILVGAQTDACIRSTLHGGLARGYDITLVSDAHTTEDMREWGAPLSPEQSIAYTNMYWQFTNAPGRTCLVTPAAEVFTSASAAD